MSEDDAKNELWEELKASISQDPIGWAQRSKVCWLILPPEGTVRIKVTFSTVFEWMRGHHAVAFYHPDLNPRLQMYRADTLQERVSYLHAAKILGCHVNESMLEDLESQLIRSTGERF